MTPPLSARGCPVNASEELRDLTAESLGGSHLILSVPNVAETQALIHREYPIAIMSLAEEMLETLTGLQLARLGVLSRGRAPTTPPKPKPPLSAGLSG